MPYKRFPPNPLLIYFSLSLCRPILGPTSLHTISHYWTGFLRWSTSFPNPNFLLPSRQQMLCSLKFPSSMVCPRTEAHSSSPGFGRPSVNYLVPRSAFPLGTTNKPMVRLNSLIKNLRRASIVSHLKLHPSGAKTCACVEFQHNLLPCASSGYLPFQCIYGYQCPMFTDLEREVGGSCQSLP